MPGYRGGHIRPSRQNLGREADLGESTTLASLIGRFERRRVRLDDRTVVLVDEVGMTDDVDLVRIAAHAERAGAKLVLIGDHRQLGAVGPGGALQALVARHPDAVHYLTGNRRQADPEERAALAALRDGDVTAAVSWYSGQDRIHAINHRDAALQAAVDAWAADIAAGKNTALYAWRRANVAALNQQARAWMQQTGRLSGPEVVSPGGLAYQAGDRVVTLGPGPNGALVTSQRATVRAVNPQQTALTIETDDGRTVTLTGTETSAERLRHGYATTVHRSQGATVTTAHLFADGGGRELAYVAMSRARHSTHVWTVAEDTAQAVEDLQREWATRRTPVWAIDIGLPDTPGGTQQPTEHPRPDEQLHIVALCAAEVEITRTAAGTIPPPAVHEGVKETRAKLERLHQDRTDLDLGEGVYADTEAGQAVRDLRQAQQASQRAAWEAEHASGWRDRRAARKNLTAWSERRLEAESRYQTHVVPEDERLEAQSSRWQGRLSRLESRANAERTRYEANAKLADEHTHTSGQYKRTVAAYRDRLDGIPARPKPVQRHLAPPEVAPQIRPRPPGISM